MTRFFSILTMLLCLNFVSVYAQTYVLIDPPPGKGYYELRMRIDSTHIALTHHRDFPQPIYSLRIKINDQYIHYHVDRYDQNQAIFMTRQDLRDQIANAREVIVWVLGNSLICVKHLKKPRQNHPLNISPKEDSGNPVTTIKYQIPQKVNVNIVIYDSLGYNIKTLVSEEQEAGYYEVVWDTTNDSGNKVGTGVFFYRIKAGDFWEVKKMVLMR